MLYIVHYFSIVVRPHGSMVDSTDSARGDGCSRSKNITGILLFCGCLFERIFLSAETSALKATTFCAQMETLFRYIPIPTNTCTYMHINEHTYKIHADTDTLHVCVYICVYM